MKFDFLTLHPQAFGLEISSTSLKVAKLSRQNNFYRLVSYGESALPKGIIQEGEIKQQDALVKALKEFSKQIKGKSLSTKYVIASLPEEKAFVQLIRLPQMKDEEVENAVRFEAENYIPYPVETVYLDHMPMPSAKKEDKHRDVLLVSLPKETVDTYLTALRKAGLVPLAMEIESFAIARALIADSFSPVPVLLLDIGTSGTNLSVFAGHNLRFTASIPISAASFTESISGAMGVDAKNAEALKTKYGIAQEGEEGQKVFSALVPLMTDFVEQIKKYAEYYETHAEHQHLKSQEARIKKVVLCGGGSLLKGLPEYLARDLNVEASLGDPWTNILPKPMKEIPPLSFHDSLRYTTALGLALRGIKQND